MNTKQERKDAKDRATILASLEEQIQRGQKQMIGNKGYQMKKDLDAMQEVVLVEGGKTIAFRTGCKDNAEKIFQSVGIAIPPTVRGVMN